MSDDQKNYELSKTKRRSLERDAVLHDFCVLNEPARQSQLRSLTGDELYVLTEHLAESSLCTEFRMLLWRSIAIAASWRCAKIEAQTPTPRA